MLRLIVKDLLVQKKMILFAVGYSLFILIAFQNPVLYNGSYIMGSMAIAYILLLGACTYDDKGKSEIILNSLPLKREVIVKARYLSVFVFLLIALVIIALMGTTMKLVGLPVPIRYMNMTDVVATSVSLLLLCSFYLPLNFKFGSSGSRIFNAVIFMLFFFLPNSLINYLRAKNTQEDLESAVAFFTSLSPVLVGVLSLVVILSIYGLSLNISQRVYRKREF